ncbi:uncharacterized protein [Pleurodeles waltl]
MEPSTERDCQMWETKQDGEQLHRSQRTENYFTVKEESQSQENRPQYPPESINCTRVISDTDESNCSSVESTSQKRQLPCLPKKCGARYYKTKFDMAWIKTGPFKGVIVPVKNDSSFFRCLICEKNVSCSHQGIFDVKRHVSGKAHRALEEKKLRNKAIAGALAEQESTEEWLVRQAEWNFTKFFAEHAIPFATADRLVRLIWQSFPDSKFAQSFTCDRTRAASILNEAIVPELLSNLTDDMRSSVFSLCIDGSSYKDPEQKACPLTVRIFDSRQGRICCKFLDMCIRKFDTAEGLFAAVCNAVYKHSIPLENCVGFGLDNTSVNMGNLSPIKTIAHNYNENIYFMACPCQVADNCALQASSAFCSFLKDFDADDLLVDLYFWFEYASKMTDLCDPFCKFADSDYRQVLKEISVRWLGMLTCLDQLILHFDSLRSYFLSTPDIAGASGSRLKRLVCCFKNPMTEIYCLFLQSSLPAFVNFNLLLQREDPVIHLLYDAIVDLLALLLSRAYVSQVVHSFMKNPEASLPDLSSCDSQITDSSLYVGIGVRGKLKNMLEMEIIEPQTQSNFFEAVRSFHQAAVKFALEVLPVHDEVLKHARVFNFFEKHKYGFESVLFMVERFNTYLKFTKKDLACLEQEFVTYQVIEFADVPAKTWEDAAIQVNCASGDDAVYRIDVIWFHLERDFIFRSTHRSKFFLLSKIARLLFTLPHSNADEERVFSSIMNNKTKSHSVTCDDKTSMSMLIFQTHRPRSEPSRYSITHEGKKLEHSAAESIHNQDRGLSDIQYLKEEQECETLIV